MADLITLNEYKSAVGIDLTDNRKDTEINTLIPWASQVVRSYTGRAFGSDSVTEQRTYVYDGSGYLDIDDATDITEVRFSVPNSSDIILDPQTWFAAPPRRSDAPVYYYIVVGTGYGAISPEMGFERNVDVLWAEGRYPMVARNALVTGTWGWPDVPGDVKLATIWTIQDWLTRPSGEGLTAEAIEGYSRAWGARTGQGPSPSLAIPNKARDILAAYQKLDV